MNVFVYNLSCWWNVIIGLRIQTCTRIIFSLEELYPLIL
uniref:Uncharacterized protein n=1 Tax=Medicago truncatula TaxID=3880 RepID=I3SXT5_MEDTR|nr:unknown [Medicago truncatula]